VNRARSDRGMTIVEMLVAMVVAMIVSLAAFALIDFTMRRTADVTGRVDADQRGRLAMDTISRQLRSQVCQPSGTVPMLNSTANPSDDTHASTDGSDTTMAPQLHTLAYDAANYRVVETDWTAKASANPSVDPTYSGTPTTRVVLTDARPIPGVPMFSYYAFGTTTPMTLPLDASELADIARIDVNFRATPSNAPKTDPDPRGSIDFQNRITVRSVDPNSDNPHPECA
jgi:type II secretory pathway pseudopilin PulG